MQFVSYMRYVVGATEFEIWQQFGRLLGRQGHMGYAVNHTCGSKLLFLGAFSEDCGIQLFLPWFCLRAGETTVGRKRRKKTQPNANGSACLLIAPVGPK